MKVIIIICVFIIITLKIVILIFKYIDSDLEISFPDAIPLNELFVAIDEHFLLRVDAEKLKKTLDDRTYQFRVIQKRLLNRFKVYIYLNDY